ncbi:MAG TPA: 4-hydroxythreonine-4-phosphate dehydrogenase PdxA [Povalibacter sp.]|nr:4-hydroxythreonine-4-phosphate dehydrogenase PdxA [Povalibacter sp.]
MPLPRIILTSGEPAGIGPDLCIDIAARRWPCELVVAADRGLLEERARALNANLQIEVVENFAHPSEHRPGTMRVLHRPLRAACRPGHLDAANARYVLDLLDAAVDGCVDGTFAAMVTAPVQKSIINDAGIPFSGHTEYLAQRTGAALPVMMLAADRLRVALATTHLPLTAVSAAITRGLLEQVLRILDHDLRTRFGIAAPRILVCGLNPHAGESGHLGREEIETITPALAVLRGEGLHLIGPVPADTAFTPHQLEQADAVLAMYHDQGLPVLKFAGFGNAVNVTLGLPIVRTSVDHGTALTLAGTGKADPGSLAAALELALTISDAAKH